MKKKGPGKWFRKGITLIEVIAMFPDDESAEKWFASMRWPDGPACPRSRGSSVQSGAAHPSMPYRCRGCGKRFSVRTGSVMADTELGYRTRAVALFLLTTGIKGVSSMKLHRDRPRRQPEVGLAPGAPHPRVPGAGSGPVRRPGGGGRDLRRRQGAQPAREQEGPRRVRARRQDPGGGRARPRHERSGRAAAAGHRRGRPAGLRARPGRAGRAALLRRGGGLRRHGGVVARSRQALRRRVRARGSAYERHRIVWVPVQARPVRNLSPDERPSSRPTPTGAGSGPAASAGAARRARRRSSPPCRSPPPASRTGCA